MLTRACKKDRQLFLSAVKRIMTSMGLKILERGVDYGTEKPDIVAVYPDKQKYYMLEVMSLGCFDKQSPRLYAKDAWQDYRDYCKKLFSENETKAAAAAAVICDLSSGIDAFSYKVIGTHVLSAMSRYAAIAVPQEKSEDVATVLEKLGLDFRNLDILDDFALVLISKEDTEKLSEKKKFISFMIANK